MRFHKVGFQLPTWGPASARPLPTGWQMGAGPPCKASPTGGHARSASRGSGSRQQAAALAAAAVATVQQRQQHAAESSGGGSKAAGSSRQRLSTTTHPTLGSATTSTPLASRPCAGRPQSAARGMDERGGAVWQEPPAAHQLLRSSTHREKCRRCSLPCCVSRTPRPRPRHSSTFIPSHCPTCLRVAAHTQLVGAPLLALCGRQVAGQQVHQSGLACKGRNRSCPMPPRKERWGWEPTSSGHHTRGHCTHTPTQPCTHSHAHALSAVSYPRRWGPQWPRGCPYRCRCSCSSCQSRRDRGT